MGEEELEATSTCAKTLPGDYLKDINLTIIYLFRDNRKNTITMYEVCSKITSTHPGIFIVNSEQVKANWVWYPTCRIRAWFFTKQIKRSKLVISPSFHHYNLPNLFQPAITCSKLTIDTSKRCEICSKLTIKTLERCIDVILVYFLLILNIFHTLF